MFLHTDIMRTNKVKIFVLFALLLTLTGCNALMPMLFGVRKINGYDAELCEKFKQLEKVEVYLINNDVMMSEGFGTVE